MISKRVFVPDRRYILGATLHLHAGIVPLYDSAKNRISHRLWITARLVCDLLQAGAERVLGDVSQILQLHPIRPEDGNREHLIVHLRNRALDHLIFEQQKWAPVFLTIVEFATGREPHDVRTICWFGTIRTLPYGLAQKLIEKIARSCAM